MMRKSNFFVYIIYSFVISFLIKYLNVQIRYNLFEKIRKSSLRFIDFLMERYKKSPKTIIINDGVV